MKHVLHKNVSGKQGADGKTYFHIYISFTDKRQTLRLKSQLVTRPITKEDFENLESIYHGEISDLLDKERELLFFCRDENSKSGDLNRNQFRVDYIYNSLNLIDLVKEARDTSPITTWEIPAISWELTKDIHIENELIVGNGKKKFKDLDLFELEVNLLEFQLAMRKSNMIDGLCLVFDWNNGGLKNELREFLRRRHNPTRANVLLDTLSQIVADN